MANRKVLIYLKEPFELTTGAFKILYGTPDFYSPIPGGSKDFVTVGILTGTTYVSIPISNIACMIWETADGEIDAAISTYVDNEGVLGYVALS